MTQPPDDATEAPAGETPPSSDSPTTQALAWVTPQSITETPGGSGVLIAPDLLSARPLARSRAALIPTGIIVGLVGAYVATTALWPLDAITPRLHAKTIEAQQHADVPITWPTDGSAAVGITGGATVESTVNPTQMASITKVVTVMTVLDHRPMKLGETGPSYPFTEADHQEYWDYLRADESALDVPVGGSLTEYQLIEGILLGSAGNYTDLLAESIWPNDAAYATAAHAWLKKVGITDITVVEPTGIDWGNTATPAALVKLSEIAMQNPVVAEIAAKPEAEIPGAGKVENTNGIIRDPGVVGLKTGRLDGYNLLSAKNVPVGDETVLAHAVVLDQTSYDERDDASRSLYDQLEKAMEPVVAVAKGTVVGSISTLWGSSTDVITDADASVSLWQQQATVSKHLRLGDEWVAGSSVGTLTATGTTGDDTVELRLAGELDPPSFWWRLTHPLDLFGLAE